MRRLCLTLLAIVVLSATAQSVPAPPPADPLSSLDFLLGRWAAKTNAPAGSAGARATGSYTFRRDLAGHIITRTTSADSCIGPKDFNCDHHDQLTIFNDVHGLDALYIDSEGHVTHYILTLPDAHTVIFLSQNDPTWQTPTVRLIYHLEGDGRKAVMTGKFQTAPQGSEDFHSYLEWSGTRQ